MSYRVGWFELKPTRRRRDDQSRMRSAIHPAITVKLSTISAITRTPYGLSASTIMLGLSQHTITGYVRDIYRKLSISSRAEAAAEAVRHGLMVC